MQKIISYPLSVLYAIVFLFWLLIFHPVQLVCYHVFGYNAHRITVAVLNFFLLRTSHILGTTYTLTGRENLPENKPLILVCNHQSMHDIIPIIWFLRNVHPKFISKKELGKGIPSVSLNLRIGGSALIDRKDGKQALTEIKKAGEYINSTNRTMVIFPEGTRSKTGKPKEFATNGLKMLYKNAPDAYFVPISINNSWKMNKFEQFPFGLGTKITFQIHDPLKISDYSFDEIFEKTEKTIKNHIN